MEGRPESGIKKTKAPVAVPVKRRYRVVPTLADIDNSNRTRQRKKSDKRRVKVEPGCIGFRVLRARALRKVTRCGTSARVANCMF